MKKLVMSLVLASMLMSSTAFAKPPKDLKIYNPQMHEWFENLENPHWPNATDGKISCCKEADGEVLGLNEVRVVDGHYEVLIDGNWITVPEYSVLNNETNPTGNPVVFFNHQYKEYSPVPTLYCFVRPPDV